MISNISYCTLSFLNVLKHLLFRLLSLQPGSFQAVQNNVSQDQEEGQVNILDHVNVILETMESPLSNK